MANTNSSKGNPASHRMGNQNLKARRAASWNRAQQKKDANRRANEAAAARNRDLRRNGEKTPFETRRMARKALRDQMRSEGLLPPVGMTRAEWEKAKGNV